MPNRVGRPRRLCAVCAAPAIYARRWWEAQPEKRAAYSLARRVKHEPRPCTECGELFTPRRSDAEMCSDLCRWRRSRRQRNAVA